MKVKTLFAAAAVLALGISAIGTATQAREATETTAIEAVVSTDFNTTWDVLVAELSEGDFTVNATIKENSTIRVLLQSKTPSTWVDCGRISVSSKHKEFGDRSYDFLAANSARYLVADEEVDQLVDVERRTNLNALANIKLTPMGQKTLVKVDAHYVIKTRTREFGRYITPRNHDSSMNFDSAGHSSATEEIRQGATIKTVTIACRPTGELERRIVSILERPHILMADNANRRLLDAPRAKETAPQKLPSQTVAAAPQLSKLFSPADPSAPKKVATIQSSSPNVLPPAEDPPAMAANAAWGVQLSSLKSQSNTEKAWNKLQQANPDLLSILTLRVQKVELAKGTYFRVQAGPLADRPAASSLCNILKKRNQDCLVVAP